MKITHLVTQLIFTAFIASSLFGMDKKMPFSIENKPSVKQNDGWQCGYFTAFHACAYHDCFAKNGSYNDLKPNENQYESWLNTILNNTQIDKIRHDKMPLEKKYRQKKWLNNDDITTIINVMVNTNTSTDLPANITYINKKELEQIPLSSQTYKSIDNYKKDTSPQFVILNISNNHWFLAIINNYGLDIIDSLYKHTDKEPLLEKLHALYNDKFPKYSQVKDIKKFLGSNEVSKLTTIDQKKERAQQFVKENEISITSHHLESLIKQYARSNASHEIIELEDSDEEESEPLATNSPEPKITIIENFTIEMSEIEDLDTIENFGLEYVNREIEESEKEETPIQRQTPQASGYFGSLKKTVQNIGTALLNYWNKK